MSCHIECHYAECCFASANTLSVLKPIIIMLSVVMLSVIVQSVVRLWVIYIKCRGAAMTGLQEKGFKVLIINF
jgi:hypothetical protein